jgi:hypothetical protein
MVEINDYFCPNENCKCYGLRGQENLVKAGKYWKDGVARQMFKCKRGTFMQIRLYKQGRFDGRNNASLAKSPTRTVTVQTNHLFASCWLTLNRNDSNLFID